MKVAEKDQAFHMWQLMDTEEQDSTLKLFAGETTNSITEASPEEMIQQLNQ